MLTQIGVEFEGAELIIPILGVTPKESLLVRKITGLSPADIDLFIGDYARDGGLYQGRRVGKRNPVMTMDLNPNPALGETISGQRELLYKAFVDPLVDADYVKVNLYDDEGRVRYFVGYTEKFETEIFDVETAAQISMICPDPYIRNNAKTLLTHASGWTTVPFSYDGTAETGFEVEIFITSGTSTLILDNNSVTNLPSDSRWHRGRMILDYVFTSDQVVYINTTRGVRNLRVTTVGNLPDAWSALTSYEVGDVVADGGTYWVAQVANLGISPEEGATWTEQDVSVRWQKLIDDGLTTSLIAALDPNCRWLELHSQSNLLKVYGAAPGELIAAVRTLAYTDAYWGV